jgi:IS4 transposase
LTNNLGWSPRTVADLYRCRWQIEVFSKQIKRTLQLADFPGHNANAVRWQMWTAGLTLNPVGSGLFQERKPGPQLASAACAIL